MIHIDTKLKTVAEKYNGHYDYDFNQSELNEKNERTFGVKGICFAHSIKWLSMQGKLFPVSFHDDIKTEAGFNDVTELAIKYYSIYQKHETDASWITSHDKSSAQGHIYENIISTRVHAIYKNYLTPLYGPIEVIGSKGDFPVRTGMHLVFLSSSDPKATSGHGVSIYIDNAKNIFKFFDPNTGEFSFDTRQKMENAVMALVHASDLKNCYIYRTDSFYLAAPDTRETGTS